MSVPAPSPDPSSTPSGLFVTVEGGEGSGKSTLISALAAAASARRIPVTVTREPGGTRLGSALRDVLLGSDVSPRAELLLFLADRAEHVERVVAPALDRGDLVLCDRFSLSTFAYQGETFPFEELRSLDAWARSSLAPDLTLLLSVPPEVGLARASRRGEPDRFESRPVEFHRAVAARYRELAARALFPVLEVDDSLPPDDLLDLVLARCGR